MSLNWAEILNTTRSIVGNRPSKSAADAVIDDEDLRSAVDLMVDEISEAVGTTTGIAETSFTTTPNEQRYSISGIDPDIGQVMEVVRSGAYMPDQMLSFTQDPKTGLPQVDALPGGWGYQPGVLDSIVALRRSQVSDSYSWEVVGGELVLMPPPRSEETVWLRYTTTANSIELLPDSAKAAVVYAAIVAMCDAILNRLGQSRASTSQYGEVEKDYLVSLASQRDRYDGMYKNEIQRLSSRRSR